MVVLGGGTVSYERGTPVGWLDALNLAHGGRRKSTGAVLNLRTTTLQKCEAFPRRARIQGS